MYVYRRWRRVPKLLSNTLITAWTRQPGYSLRFVLVIAIAGDRVGLFRAGWRTLNPHNRDDSNEGFIRDMWCGVRGAVARYTHCCLWK